MGRTSRTERVREALERVRVTHSPKERVEFDPVSLVHPFADPLDREIAGLVASSLAFGNVTTIRAKVKDALGRLGAHPAKAARPGNEARVHAAMKGFRHRTFQGEDVARLVVGAGAVQREDGSLGAAFARDFRETHDVQESLGRLVDRIRAHGKFPSKSRRRGPSHLLPNPRAGSSVKRLLLFLRWMVRVEPGVDFGQWDVPTSALLVPVDVHVHRLGYNLGFTDRKAADWRTAEEITAALRAFDPEDPVKYDFPLCHLGISQRCPSRRDEKRCEGCGIKDVCRHWR
jgi:uncharacterized protein (TIGR02757 family)